MIQVIADIAGNIGKCLALLAMSEWYRYKGAFKGAFT